MTLTTTSGSTTSTSSEANLFDITGTAHYATEIFLHNMTATETIVLKVYFKDDNGATMRLYKTITLSGVQAEPAGFISFLPARQYKVTIQRTAGSDRAYTWDRIEVT